MGQCLECVVEAGKEYLFKVFKTHKDADMETYNSEISTIILFVRVPCRRFILSKFTP
ncbi:hypothetical protein [Okeania sp.]|uniref:hypothetical protein n=1 Tax=Okeania sp. TaxID=3100323 RepID=UPI002B4AB70B|nr:hypothetical protein [Okeania sp.]